MYYSAKLVFEIKPLTHGVESTSIEKRIVLIESPNEFDAASKANLIGEQSEFNYEASDGGTVIVSFIGIENIYHIIDDKIGHGTEIYSETEYKTNR